MSVRKQTSNRLNLIRTCHKCGKTFSTTAASPWMRSIPNADGDGRQRICYFCSTSCYQASYKHIGWYDGKCAERKRERDAKRDRREEYRRYYAEHREKISAKKKEFRRLHPGYAAADAKYHRKKRKLLSEHNNVEG